MNNSMRVDELMVHEDPEQAYDPERTIAYIKSILDQDSDFRIWKFAMRIGVDEKDLSKALRGLKPLPFRWLPRIAKALNKHVVELYYGMNFPKDVLDGINGRVKRPPEGSIGYTTWFRPVSLFQEDDPMTKAIADYLRPLIKEYLSLED